MRLRGIEFGDVWDASGVRGWFGEGQPFHPFLRPFGLGFAGATFVAKTTTLHPRQGNLRTTPDRLRPRLFRQPSVEVRWWKGVALNAVGLTGPGFEALLATGRWQALRDPFFLSFMAVAPTPEERLAEVQGFVRLLRQALPSFSAPVGLQVNLSCPNVALEMEPLVRDAARHLDEYATLGIPVVPKLSVASPVEFALAIGRHPACDALCVSNTIPWGKLPDRIDWRGLFGSDRSPLERFGGGGLSGWPLLPLVAEWVRDARARGFARPINAGGGVLRPRDVDVLLDAGAESVFIGSMTILRGWRVQRTIRHALRAAATRRATSATAVAAGGASATGAAPAASA